MLGAKKPAMIYFSQQPAIPDSVDQEQYKALAEFGQWCRSNSVSGNTPMRQSFGGP